jgi:hypothetical protein
VRILTNKDMSAVSKMTIFYITCILFCCHVSSRSSQRSQCNVPELAKLRFALQFIHNFLENTRCTHTHTHARTSPPSASFSPSQDKLAEKQNTTESKMTTNVQLLHNECSTMAPGHVKVFLTTEFLTYLQCL